MRSSRICAVVAFHCLVGSAWSAAPLVALRVEVTARAGVEAGTEVAIAVAIAPEDRGRLGQRAFLSTTLSVGETVRERSQQVVDLVDGHSEVVAVWPPGRYDLRVDVEGSDGGQRGFWVGAVDVPRRAPRPTAIPPATATPLAAVAATAVPAAPTPPASALPAAPAPVAAAPPAPAPPTRVAAPTVASGASRPCSLTLLAMDARNQPVRDLTRDDLAVEVAGQPTGVTGFAGSGSPLHLVVVVAATDELASFAAASRRAVLRLAEAATASGGQVALQGTETGAWTADPGELDRALAAADPGPTPVPARIAAAVARLAEVGGRRAVVVIVGAGDDAERGEWDAALDAAATAGTPVLTMVAAGGDVPQRLRSRVRELAERSGGRSYTVRGEDLVDLTATLYRGLLEASVSVAVAAPSAADPARVQVATSRAGVKLSHSATLVCR